MSFADDRAVLRQSEPKIVAAPLTLSLHYAQTIATDAIAYYLSHGDLQANIVRHDSLPTRRDETADVTVIVQSPLKGLPMAAEIIAAFRSCGAPPTLVIVASAFATAVPNYVEAGIQGVLSHTTRLPVLAHAVRLVSAGGRFVSQELLDAQWAQAGTLADRVPAHFRGRIPLTTREREVLALLRQGQSNKQIAGALEIAETTAKLHVRRLMQKLNVENRTQAALAAGLI